MATRRSTRRRPLVWILLVLLASCALLVALGYRMMIAVKPSMTRPTLGPDARREVEALEARLMGHVEVLGRTIGERHLGRPRALQAAAEYIRQAWADQGLALTEERFEVGGQPVLNLITQIPGRPQAGEILVVGAHYDSVVGSPGANDNGTGVAALLEMSRQFRDHPLSRTVRLVAFVNEEPPYFLTDEMGSRVHARGARRRGERILGMLSLETIGYYSDARSTQHYPAPFGMLYPDTGNFLAVVGNLASRRLVVEFMTRFMSATDFPVEGVATFEGVPGINWSDHSSFWSEGYPAIMLTDTAPFRYAEYHTAQDVPERVTRREFARAAHGIMEAVRRLAGG
jgi:Peptidase family M28